MMDPTLDIAERQARPKIVVFGSCFMDYIGYTPRIPNPGETITSTQFAKGFGGKGANQAVMSAILGGNVAMVASIGSDGDGDDYVENFRRLGVQTKFLRRESNQSTGLAMIVVDENARNSIVICPNAAGKTSFASHFEKPVTDAIDERRAKEADPFTDCKILVCQNEIPLEATLTALVAAHKRGIYTIFNTAPAPTPDQLPQIIPVLNSVSLFCPNEHEAAILTGIKITDMKSAEENARKLQSFGIRDVVITLGSEGVLVAEQGAAPVHIASHKVKAIDTTGAGDCFVGTMAFFLAEGCSLRLACEKANYCAAQSVMGKGTQTSYPSRKSLPAQLFAPTQDVSGSPSKI